MITADTITREQLIDLLRLGEQDEADAAMRALREPRRHFNGLGVGDEHMARQAEDQRKARAWCAALINTRVSERRCRDCESLCDHSTWDGINCPWCRNSGRRVDLTATTITEEQLRALLTDPAPHVCHSASAALFCSDPAERANERARCAEFVNARKR